MLVSELLPGYNGKFNNVNLDGITDDSRKVGENYAFVCINGPVVDGHNFAEKSGARVVICERDLGLDNQIIVEDTHAAFAYMCAKWFDFPSEKLHLIGVTGTNGKTSVTYMLKCILESAGHKVGLIGTIQNLIGQRVIDTKNTTPGIFELNSLFSQMVKEGCDYAVMEVSSHALYQRRVEGLKFKEAIFTNLSQDHLDYHKTMENYCLAKKILFTMCETAIVNKDDEWFNTLTANLKCKIKTYSFGNESDFSAKNIKYRPSGIDYELFGDGKINHVKVDIAGKFTVYNSMAACTAAIAAGIDATTACGALSKIKGVSGRAEVYDNDCGFTVIIDYAHTPDGLKNILCAFKECPKNRLVVLFGCGGDRDKTKRSVMGSVAVHNADYVILTSDNPRSEEPSEIIDDILEGTRGRTTPVKVIENRIEAIKFAIKNAQKDDIIILAGKGHENYQILKDKTIHLDEREVLKEAFEELKKG